jgi:hypothetical protein
MRALSEDPRPEGVHVLSEAQGLYRLHLSRLHTATLATVEYRVTYLVDDDEATVMVILLGALPPKSRRR